MGNIVFVYTNAKTKPKTLNGPFLYALRSLYFLTLVVFTGKVPYVTILMHSQYKDMYL